MKKFTLALLFWFLTISMVFSVPQRGDLYQAAPLPYTVSPVQIMLNVQSYLDPAVLPLLDAITWKKFHVQAVRILYYTDDGHNGLTWRRAWFFFL